MFEQRKNIIVVIVSHTALARAETSFMKKQQHQSQPQRVVFINEIKAISAWDAPLKDTSREFEFEGDLLL